MLGDVAYKAASIGVVFATYGGVGEGDDGEGNVGVYITDYGEVIDSWFDKVHSRCHFSVILIPGVVESRRTFV